MISDFKEIHKFFDEVSKHIGERVDIYLIGGGALMYHKSKNLTKDIDLVVNTEREFDLIVLALKNMSFRLELPDHHSYSRLNISQMFVKDEFRIDLFCKTVCRKFSLSEGMIKRATTIRAFGNILLHVCSEEDILLFKCITDRPGDLDDCMRITYEHLLDWDIVLREAQEQSRTGKDVWITWITERLEILEENNIKVPIINEMRSLSEECREKWEMDLLSRNPDAKLD
ncbi:hypothetical protein Mpt1_c10250 [Candidatus Methanoplasma termitum]|uniref:DUF6036 domain-containing protein n=1 Tax=Candidatus Methanoplasma termitum TaxID=1577791 RepID=A0A0A7LEZ2_9ARCH|nr:DUF6036 family nucleotidyltransferase [Candidatus Methanoplasma termitum]AIZ56897.1 hypothetical protein Mpt1_c10250 [Candidatus Methanoplasma termitum]